MCHKSVQCLFAESCGLEVPAPIPLGCIQTLLDVEGVNPNGLFLQAQTL